MESIRHSRLVAEPTRDPSSWNARRYHEPSQEVLAIFARIAADDHQTKNAADLVTQGAAVLLSQKAMTPASLAAEIERLLKNDDTRRIIADSATRAGRLQAAEVIARAAIAGFRAQASHSEGTTSALHRPEPA